MKIRWDRLTGDSIKELEMTKIIHRAEKTDESFRAGKRLEEEFGREKADEIIKRESIYTVREFEQPLDGSVEAVSVEHALEAARRKNPISAPEPRNEPEKKQNTE